MFRDWQRDFLLIGIFWLSLTASYNAKEAHKHTHEAINVCSEHPVFNEDGRRLP